VLLAISGLRTEREIKGSLHLLRYVTLKGGDMRLSKHSWAALQRLSHSQVLACKEHVQCNRSLIHVMHLAVVRMQTTTHFEAML
jgi:hypothetical protein